MTNSSNSPWDSTRQDYPDVMTMVTGARVAVVSSIFPSGSFTIMPRGESCDKAMQGRARWMSMVRLRVARSFLVYRRRVDERSTSNEQTGRHTHNTHIPHYSLSFLLYVCVRACGTRAHAYTVSLSANFGFRDVRENPRFTRATTKVDTAVNY